jgi:myosin heavy subunit
MAKSVDAKLTKLSNEYSANVKKVRELEAAKKKPFATDAEVKRINEEINKLEAERKTIVENTNTLSKAAKNVDEYTDLNKKLAQYEAQIAKRIARGEGTADLDKIKQETLGKLSKIAPAVEENFPELKKAEPKSTKTGPMGNVQMTTGTTVAGTAASKAAAAKKKAAPAPAVDQQLKPTPKPGKIPSTTAFAQEDVVDTTTLEGIRKASARTATGTKTATGSEDINAIYALARSKYDNVDSIFLYDPELKQILIDAVGDIATAKDDMEPEEFLRRLNASDWAIRNASTYRARDAQRREYNETLDKYNKQLEMADTQEKKDAILAKIGQLKTTSSYARGLASAKAFIEATASGLTGTMDPARLDAFVKRMYDSANDKDPNIINRELAALISYKPGTQLGGSVGADLTKLRATARANGFDLDTTFKDQINNWMQRLAVGESVETFQNTIRSQAKLGLPDKVANLLDQGLDLANIYAPYKNVMAAVLEVAPDSINLNDGTLRSAIGPEKEMSLYDFQRVLRKDPRWQYTDNARTEASDSVLKVLRDFGFQG